MPICKKCGDYFPWKILIGGIRRNLQKRKYCLSCSPFGGRNTTKLHATCKREDRACESCGQAIHRGKYCSVKCQRALVHRQYIERWLRGEEAGIISSGLLISNHIKHWLRETRGEKCECCGWAVRHAVTGKVPVQVNHKDGDALNNRPENLELLCPNCHSLTPTFGALNMGNGRHYRRVRYAEGKSS